METLDRELDRDHTTAESNEREAGEWNDVRVSGLVFAGDRVNYQVRDEHENGEIILALDLGL